ncbi:Protein of unknown function [Lactobacillus delbrueckii subsp. bulgaricus]|nr:Protein of unknown function [Lactobacillus delbrueckii subsp. bulgaricus]
MKNTHPANR